MELLNVFAREVKLALLQMEQMTALVRHPLSKYFDLPLMVAKVCIENIDKKYFWWSLSSCLKPEILVIAHL